jgi:PAS domain S-box-containing protein
MAERPSYEELEARLAQAENSLNAISNTEVDALVGQDGVYLLRLNELEKALRESEQKFRAAFANATVGFALTTPGGRFLEANAAYCSVAGYCFADLKALDFQRVIHPDDYAKTMKLMDRMLAGDIPDFVIENRYARKDGESVWVRNSVSVVRGEEGAPRWMIILAEDIAARKLAEASLSRSLARIEEGEFTLNTLMETVPEGITIADTPDVRVLQVSRYGKELLGKTGEELEGIPLELHAKNWDIYESDGKTRAKNEDLPLTRAVRKGETVTDEEWIFGTADGKRIPVLCNAAPIIDKSQRIIGGILAWRDIGELRRLADALRDSNQDLRDYSHVLTHKLKEPLRAIHHYVDFLFEDLGNTLEGEPKRYLEGIKESLTKSHRQFQDLEALYGVKNHPMNSEVFDMKELVDEMHVTFKDTPGGRLVAREDWPVLTGEKHLLRQILTHLIGNGFKYNREEMKRVEVGWQKAAENGIEIFVRDNGIGIQPQFQEEIFGIFKRLHADHEHEGTGIGLAIVRRAAQKIGATLRVESTLGEGSTFYLDLPSAMAVDARHRP